MLTRGFMLDTCAINRIHDGRDCEWSLRGPLYVTDIQLQEIAQTRNRERRESLMQAFFSLRPSTIRPHGMIFDAEFFGFATYCAEGSFLPAEDFARPIGRIMPHLAAALGSRMEKQFRDAMIGEAALRNSLTLVTSDRKLGKVASSFGACVEVIQ